MPERQARGYCLIEAVTALLLLALGTLGATALQLAALRSQQQADWRTHAVQLVSSMADAMRANGAQMHQDDHNNPYLNAVYDATANAAPAAPSPQCWASSPCTSAQLAAADIYELQQQLKASLPGARLLICRDGKPWDVQLQRFSWSCSGLATDAVVIKLGWTGRVDAAPDAPGVALMLAGQ